MKYFFIFSISPVQSFIAMARKTQDLYAGSFILSYIANVAMDALEEKIGIENIEWIFPQRNNDIDFNSIPNRFVCICDLKDKSKDEITQIGNDVKAKVENELKNIAYVLIEKVKQMKEKSSKKKGNSNGFLPNAVTSQIKKYFNVNWIFYPYDGDYEKCYKEAERVFGAVKNARIFEQIREEAGRKCALSGTENALFFKRNEKGNIPAFTVKEAFVVKEGEGKKFLIKGEAIGGVAFLKRFAEFYFEEKGIAEYNSSFPSTSLIALMDFIEGLKKDEKGRSLLKSYKNLVHSFDEELYFEENITENFLKKYEIKGRNGEKRSELVNKLQKKLKEITDHAKELREKGNGEDEKEKRHLKFSKYYALLMMDGDSMGRWLSGKFLKDDVDLLEFHKEMTKEMTKFSNTVRGIIEESNIGKLGSIVYCGGDDLLAFVNIVYLMDVLKRVRSNLFKFEEIEIDGRRVVKDGCKTTASCGVVIAHYKTPLREVLKKVRAMEKKAKGLEYEVRKEPANCDESNPTKQEGKETKRKDALAIAVLKRSGEIQEAVFPWIIGNGEDVWVSDVLSHIANKLEDGTFSNTFIKGISYEFEPMMNIDGSLGEMSIDVVLTEMKRLIKRACMVEKKEEETQEEFKARKSHEIKCMFENVEHLLKWCGSKRFKNFLHALDIADFIYRGVAV